MSNLSSSLLEIIRSPDSGAGLRAQGSSLVTRDPERDSRYRVEHGIPVLLPSVARGDAQPRDRRSRARMSIIKAFQTRSVSYYRDNYVAEGNPERIARNLIVSDLLRAKIAPRMRVLEAGAGPLVLAETIQSLTDGYVAVDLSLENLREGRQRVGPLDAVVGDLTALPLANEAFDGVVAVGCLEYVVDVEAAIAELCRVTKRHGFIIATFANRRSPRRRWDETVVHRLARVKQSIRGGRGATYRRYLIECDDARQLLARSGATVETVEYLNQGIVGYPLSGVASIRRGHDQLADRAEFVRRRASEFVVVATKT